MQIILGETCILKYTCCLNTLLASSRCAYPSLLLACFSHCFISQRDEGLPLLCIGSFTANRFCAIAPKKKIMTIFCKGYPHICDDDCYLRYLVRADAVKIALETSKGTVQISTLSAACFFFVLLSPVLRTSFRISVPCTFTINLCKPSCAVALRKQTNVLYTRSIC